jgi:hypothetical protein
MSSKQAAYTGLAISLVGAVLAFALESDDSSFIGVRLQSFGAVLLGAGALLTVSALIAASSSSGGGSAGQTPTLDNVKAIGGLVAVVSAIIGVAALTIVTQARLSSDKANSIVAVCTTAFGVISAVVGAYLGIKVTADQSSDAQHQAQLAHQQLGAATQAAAEAAPEKREAIKRAVDQAVEDASKTNKAGRDGD